MNKDISYQRIEFWCKVYSDVASAANCVDKDTPYIWADIALKEFDKRFGNENKSKN